MPVTALMMQAVRNGGATSPTPTPAATFDFDLAAYVPDTGVITSLDSASDAGGTVTLLSGSTANVIQARSTEAAYNLLLGAVNGKSTLVFGSDAGEDIKQVRVGNWQDGAATGGPVGMYIGKGATSGAIDGWYAYKESAASNVMRVLGLTAGAYDGGGVLIDVAATGDVILQYKVSTNKLAILNGDGSTAQEITPTAKAGLNLKGLHSIGNGATNILGISGNRWRTSGNAT